MRVVLILAAGLLMAQPVYDCGADLADRWNKFAHDANAYVKLLGTGGTDYRLKKKVETEFERVKGCECW